ncbi:MAG: adenine phosphoribosyltransferase [Candidatus Hydrogenedentes bacterium]|nr:adenine phosphoribosyltransferase [Candidatus Hydrogenedentota bacterium]
MDLAALIRNVPDFPKPGIQFKDITTLLLHPEALEYITAVWKDRYSARGLDAIVAADARGFVFGAALAHAMHLPLVLARKKGKLPADTLAEDYHLEYGTATVEIHSDALKPGQRVLLVDDLLATGGTMAAIARIVRRMGAEIVEAAFVVELPPLNGRAALDAIPVHSLVTFMVD